MNDKDMNNIYYILNRTPEQLEAWWNSMDQEDQEYAMWIIKEYKKDDVPYGVLKGGIKPTYRNWNRTYRADTVTNPNSALIIEGNINRDKNKRETHLENLRRKLKLRQIENSNTKGEDIMMTQNLIQKPTLVESNKLDVSNLNDSNLDNKPNLQIEIKTEPKIEIETETETEQDNNKKINDTGGNIIAIKKITKKTIKRKYTLGKSKIKKTIGVLVKDKGTRKKILNAQKELKRKPINDVKTYLRDHNLIKIGTGAPNDVSKKCIKQFISETDLDLEKLHFLFYFLFYS
jgi:hypothetical protein